MAEEHRFQLSTDDLVFYRRGVEDVFAGQADFAQIIKICGDYGQHDAAGRYSPAPMIETIIKIWDGRPDRRHISALHFAYYNFCRIHKSLRVTPAMEAGLTNHIWTVKELLR